LRLLKAFHLFKAETKSNFKLVLAGAIFWGENEMVELMKSLKIEDEIIFTGRIANEELKNLIASAFALTYLPYFEGFGIPIVEAMQCGTPILAANTSCLPEIAGDAAIYANPFDENEIKHAMLTLYEDGEIRSNLIRKGLEQKNKYSWDKTANLLWCSIENAL
jgi:glycosyltransferase involved in cell wall biosynthesis